MESFSKILPYSCYELGHCWKHSCSSASFEICIIGFIESIKIYGVVYLLTGLVNARKISMKYGKKLLKNYLTSVCFLTVNAFGYIGSYCVVRRWNLSRPSFRNAGRISGDDCRLPSTRRSSQESNAASVWLTKHFPSHWWC
ncbi:transmembrane protein 135-like isoform X2 [Scylla paramamosain]|uniref:transmembrane protein 135-like isoform X2 n=1 Tax=Scylla paramamosain TaxID=85552 RepID=UPI00308398E7